MAINVESNPTILAAGFQIYADAVIKGIVDGSLPFIDFAHNFSTEISSQPNGGIFVPFVEADVVAEYDATSNNFATGTDAVTKGCNVKLGAHPILHFAVTPEMVAGFKPDMWTAKAELNAREIANNIFTQVASVATSSKVTNTYELPAALTVEAIVELAYQAYAKKINVKNATLYLAGKDYFDFIKAMDFKTVGSTIILDGTLAGHAVGFKKIECLPVSCTTSFIATPDLVCIAARPFTDGMGAGGNILQENVYADEVIQLPLTQTLVRDSATKKLVHNIDCWYGAELGNKNCGIKLTRATTEPIS